MHAFAVTMHGVADTGAAADTGAGAGCVTTRGGAGAVLVGTVLAAAVEPHPATTTTAMTKPTSLTAAVASAASPQRATTIDIPDRDLSTTLSP